MRRVRAVWQDEDYDVLADGKVVGRIFEGSRFGPPANSPIDRFDQGW